MAREIRLAAFGFDVDGTILDSQEAYLTIINMMYRRLGLAPLSHEKLKKSSWRTIQRFFRARDVSEEDASDEELYQTFSKIAKNFGVPRLVKNTKQVLQELKNRGFILFVVSRRPENEVLKFLDAHERVTHLFSRFWCGFGDKTGALLEAKNLYGEFAYVGDLSTDVVQAKRAGGLALVSTWGLDHPELLAGSPFDFWLEALEEILFLPIKSFKEK